MVQPSDEQESILQHVFAVARAGAAAMGISPGNIHEQHIAAVSTPRPYWIVTIQADSDETMRIRVTPGEHQWSTTILHWEIQPAAGEEYLSDRQATGSYHGAPRSTDLWLKGERIGWAELAGRTAGRRPLAVYRLYDKGLRALDKRQVAGHYVLLEHTFARLPDEQEVLWEEEHHDGKE